MSKWLNKDKFKAFVNKRQEDQSSDDQDGFAKKWKNPQMGTVEKAKEYTIRLLPDKQSQFYLRYFYHYFVTDEKHHFITCPKTENMDSYCPWCSMAQQLYRGNKEDKAMAKTYSRREKFVGNILILDDPRDDGVDDEYKVKNSVRLYEFPATIESKIKSEITDKTEGYGMAVFDPENGHNMIIKIKSKKPDANGKAWPDYADTMFSRSPSSLGTEKEIDEIMEGTVDLAKHLKDGQLSWQNHEKLLKIEGFWEDVQEEFERRTGTKTEVKAEPKVAVLDPADEPMEELGDGVSTDTPFDTPTDQLVPPEASLMEEDEEALLEKLKNL